MLMDHRPSISVGRLGDYRLVAGEEKPLGYVKYVRLPALQKLVPPITYRLPSEPASFGPGEKDRAASAGTRDLLCAESSPNGAV